MTNHECSYADSKIQPIEVIEAWNLDFHLGNVVKYLKRASSAPKEATVKELQNAIYYLSRKIALLSGEDPVENPVEMSSAEAVKPVSTAQSKSKIATIDVDGVVCDLTPCILNAVGGRVKPGQITSWNYKDHLNESEYADLLDSFNDPDFWSEIPVVKRARPGISQLKKYGYEIIWVTSPYLLCRDFEYVRRDWLSQHFNANPDDIIFTSRKELVSGDLFIDDKPEHVERWQLAHPAGQGVIFSAPYNQNHKFRWRLDSWAEIDKLDLDQGVHK